jgi:bifunctional ADP-heptose synthase (sugar kinase/adenylyltransferase)
VLVKGSDYKPEDIVGYDIVTAKGGSVKTIDFIPGYSTSLIEKKIKTT